MNGAFVILEHSGYGASHLDLMLETGEVLATWRIDAAPGDMSVGQSAGARKLADHRRAYLTHEGPVSGGRGRVRQVQQGRYEGSLDAEGVWRVTLRGRGASCEIELSPGPDAWALTRRL